MPKIFRKLAIELHEQVTLLRDRGLFIPDEEQLTHYLRTIGYFRLKGYALAFQTKDEPDRHRRFQAGTTFDQVLDIYVFDRKLRLLVLDALERIEVAVRAAISYEMSVAFGPHWFTDPKLFRDDGKFFHDELLVTIERDMRSGSRQCQEPIRHYYDNYRQDDGNPAFPPSWSVFETLSFGTMSKIFRNLPDEQQSWIAYKNFHLRPPVFSSWIHTISYIRNLVAHHARLWNRQFTITPATPHKGPYRQELLKNTHFYAQAVVLQVLLDTTSRHTRDPVAHYTRWAKRLAKLFDEYPSVPLNKTGFPDDWRQRNFWKERLES